MDEQNDQPARHIWSREQMRKALSDLVKAATRRKSNFMMHIPRQPDDADSLLVDVIHEVLEWRAGRERLETVEQVLTRMVRYYDERARASRKVADHMAANPSMQLHHSMDAYSWAIKAETVRLVARNLEIEIPAEEGAAPVSGSPPLSGWHQHIYLDGLEIFPATGKPPTETEHADGQP